MKKDYISPLIYAMHIQLPSFICNSKDFGVNGASGNGDSVYGNEGNGMYNGGSLTGNESEKDVEEDINGGAKFGYYWQ